MTTLFIVVLSTLHFAVVSAGSGRGILNGFVSRALLPFLLAGLSCTLARGMKSAFSCLLGCILLSGLGFAAYASGLVHPDAQNGRLLVFIPMWQLAIGVVLFVIIAATNSWQTAPTTYPHDPTR